MFAKTENTALGKGEHCYVITPEGPPNCSLCVPDNGVRSWGVGGGWVFGGGGGVGWGENQDYFPRLVIYSSLFLSGSQVTDPTGL